MTGWFTFEIDRFGEKIKLDVYCEWAGYGEVERWELTHADSDKKFDENLLTPDELDKLSDKARVVYDERVREEESD
jgi:hypothetical protein